MRNAASQKINKSDFVYVKKLPCIVLGVVVYLFFHFCQYALEFSFQTPHIIIFIVNSPIFVHLGAQIHLVFSIET